MGSRQQRVGSREQEVVSREYGLGYLSFGATTGRSKRRRAHCDPSGTSGPVCARGGVRDIDERGRKGSRKGVREVKRREGLGGQSNQKGVDGCLFEA